MMVVTGAELRSTWLAQLVELEILDLGREFEPCVGRTVYFF